VAAAADDDGGIGWLWLAPKAPAAMVAESPPQQEKAEYATLGT
jgi:hypothetical protein